LDAQYAESGDERAARRDAEVYLALDLGLNPLTLGVTTPATARGVRLADFEELAYSREKLETVKVPKKEKSKAELEREWSAEIKVQFQEELKKFLEKEWLEDLKPARVEESLEIEKPETFDVFQVTEAWVKKRCHFVSREEKEALQSVRKICMDAFLSLKPEEKVERDRMLVQMEKWQLEDLQQQRQEFCQLYADLENRYNVYRLGLI